MSDDDNVIRVDFRKKKAISEDEVEILSGLNKRQLEYAILKLNFISCFSDDLEEISKALNTMADLTGALYDYDWFPDSIDFFEDFLSRNTHWHIKECEDENKKERLKEEYWRKLINEWRSR